MLLEADVAAQNSQAELAQQMLGVSVRVLEVRPDVGVEGRPEVTHLQKNEPENSQVVFERQVVKMKKVFWQTWQMYGISPGLCVVFMCHMKAGSLSNSSSHILHNATRKRHNS